MCESSHFYAGDFWLSVKKGRECQVHAPRGRSRAGDATDPGGAIALTLRPVREHRSVHPTTQPGPMPTSPGTHARSSPRKAP